MLAKRIAIIIAIAALLPLTVFFGVNLIDAPSDSIRLTAVKFEERKSEAKTNVEKRKIADEETKRNAEQEAVEKRHARALFYIAYPIGFLAFLIGGFVNLRADSLGLMYGGMLTLAEGCYLNWDNMDRWVRFDALVIAFAAILVCGYVKFRPDDVRLTPPAPVPRHPTEA